MPLSVMDLYKDVLPKTNCRDCGFPTCLAFAGKVVTEKLPLENCPHIDPELLAKSQAILEEQWAQGKWLKKDPAQDALNWAKERASSMKLQDVAGRIGGVLKRWGNKSYVELPYFNTRILIAEDGIRRQDGTPLNRWEQVFIYNHMAQGGRRDPTGRWKALEEIPNTVSKIKSMKEHVEVPLVERFRDNTGELIQAAKRLGAQALTETANFRDLPQGFSSDLAFLFRPLPKVPVMLLYWRGDRSEGFGDRVKLLFDETIVEHLDIESIIFLSERLMELLTGKEKAPE